MKLRFFRQKSDIKNESGQSVILVSLMILSFLMFFSFAINTGLLINAKISVQTAADAAAYAGAAAQARQLNAISFLNYEMRRQYKKFLFRYVFTGGIGNPNFPTPSSGKGNEYDFWKLDFSGGPSGSPLPLKVPVVCIPVIASSSQNAGGSAGAANDNCLQVNIRNTAFDVKAALGGLGSLDPIVQSYLQGVMNLANLQNQACGGQSEINKFTLISWLFRPNTDDTDLINLLKTTMQALTLNAADQAKTISMIQPLVSGLGLYPRNLLNLLRIHTLESFINEKPLEVTLDDVNALEKGSGADAHERTILAFKSALSNLNDSVFDTSRITLQELEPASMLNLQDTKVDFKVYVQTLYPDSNSQATTCESLILPFDAIGAPVGVKRTPSSGTQVTYAVKLRTFIKPRGLLFLPGRDGLELDAMAGAKPFGSRIGPADGSLWSKMVNGIPPVNGQEVCKDNCISPFLNVGAGSGFFSVDFLQELRNYAGGKTLSASGILDAQRHALAPNPEEIGVYNILPPPPESADKLAYQFLPYSADQSRSSSPEIYRFYAPVFRDGDAANMDQKINQAVNALFAATSVGNNKLGFSSSGIADLIKTKLKSYINGPLQRGDTSENQETETFAAIELPMIKLQNSSKGFWLTSAQNVLSSWSPDHQKINSSEVRFTPRFSYSVKLVAIRDLLRQGVPNSDPDMDSVSH